MKLIVCLGNVGKEYNDTRHNVGFMVADYIWDNFQLEKKFDCYFFKSKLDNEDYIVIKPTTYMNNSGFAVKKVVNYYNINIEDILVIQDDMDIFLGNYKLKRNSSFGGHNGIKSIINCLNTDAFLRLKIGISHDDKNNVIDYVLGKFSKSEKNILIENFSVYKNIVECFIINGGEKVLELYNKKNR